MVIRGNTRGNGKQLAQYLVAKSENERIDILDVDGREQANAEYLQQLVISMDAMAVLTKSQKGLYHAQINPAYTEDKKMDWLKAADMLGKELGLDGQRRVVVLHEKKGRTHGHVVWERYDHDTGKIKGDSFSRLAQDRARKSMELEFGHQQTPHRNIHRPELKASLTQLWHQTGTGAQFLSACRNNNYLIAEGVGRHPFMVVDERGRTYDLVRQLNGIRLKDVRERLRNETLMKEKAAIAFMRNKQTILEQSFDAGTAKKRNNHKTIEQTQAFATNKAEQTIVQDKAPEIIKEFADNRPNETLTERDRLRQAFVKEREVNREIEKNRDRDMGLEL